MTVFLVSYPVSCIKALLQQVSPPQRSLLSVMLGMWHAFLASQPGINSRMTLSDSNVAHGLCAYVAHDLCLNP